MPRGIHGSRDIRDETIESVDIKDGTIQFSDFSSEINWKAPVVNLEDLPLTNNIGDARVVLNESTIHIWTGSVWNNVAQAGSYASSDFNTDFATKTTDDLIEGVTNKYFYDHNHSDLYYTETESDTLFVNKSGDTITGNLSITGNLTVDGITTTLNTETVLIEDNLIEINSNQSGAPLSTLISGLEINRGTEVNYQLIFSENSDTFRVGEIGNTQPVATREDTPTVEGITVWDDINKQLKTSSDLIFNQTTGLSTTKDIKIGNYRLHNNTTTNSLEFIFEG